MWLHQENFTYLHASLTSSFKSRVLAFVAFKNLLKGGSLPCLENPEKKRQMGNTKLAGKCTFNTILNFFGHDIFSCLKLTVPQVPFYWVVPEA